MFLGAKVQTCSLEASPCSMQTRSSGPYVLPWQIAVLSDMNLDA